MNHLQSSPPKQKTSVCIVGGGPIGIELAVALKRHDFDFELIEAGQIGQTMTWWAPQTKWFSSNERIAIAGVPLVTPDQQKATREQYLTYLRGVVGQFSLRIRTFERVVDVQRDDDARFRVISRPVSALQSDAEHHCVTRCDAVVLAIGGTDYPKRLQVPGEELPHVDGYLREPHRYFGRRVMIVGGRNSAVEAALRLHHAGAKVVMSYRGAAFPSDGIKYWLSPEINGLISAGRIRSFFSTVPRFITQHSIGLENLHTGSVDEVPVDDVLLLIGYQQDKSLFKICGVELRGPGGCPVYNPETMETGQRGIYVAGTAVAGTQTSKYKTFLENCHDHVDKIVTHLGGSKTRSAKRDYLSQTRSMPES